MSPDWRSWSMAGSGARNTKETPRRHWLSTWLLRGWASWNIEYRRLGRGGGWPGSGKTSSWRWTTSANFPEADAAPLAIIGHSAGGHLALWAAHRSPNGGTDRGTGRGHRPRRHWPRPVVAGSGEARRLLAAGAPPTLEAPPSTLLVHGDEDELVPVPTALVWPTRLASRSSRASVISTCWIQPRSTGRRFSRSWRMPKTDQIRVVALIHNWVGLTPLGQRSEPLVESLHMRLRRLSFVAGWVAVALLAMVGFAVFDNPEADSR